MRHRLRAWLYRAATDWLRRLLFLAGAAAFGLVVAALAGLWLFCAQSGRQVCFWSSTNLDGSPCSYQHAGWGYGPTTVWFVLALWTLASFGIWAAGKPKE